MSPKFYRSLWFIFAVAAAALWLGNLFTMLTAVIFGFIAFGLIFTGMMCVLPAMVAHPPVSKAGDSARTKVDPAVRPVKVHNARPHAPLALRSN
jgi:hypothetical protein